MEDSSCSPLEASPYSLECSQEGICAASITCDALASPTHVQTIMRSGLSHIHHLLEEEDDPAAARNVEDAFSFSELIGYYAKASEFAAILKEDSPALNFDFTLEERPQNLAKITNISKGPFLLAQDHVAGCSEKKLHWMISSKPPRILRVPTSCMSSRFPDAAVYRSLSAWPIRTSQEEVGSSDAIGAIHVNASRRHDKNHRIMYALKPRKENHKKVSGQTEISHECVDLNKLLLKCAEAIGSNNTKAAMEILVKVKQHASPYGNGKQRLAYYFAEALDARLAGTGWHIYLGYMQQHRPSSKEIWKASWMYMSSCPFAKAFRFFSNRTILDVAKGASTLHIMEHEVTGFQYPSLFKALAARPGGPPRVRLIGSNAPAYAMVSSQIEEVLDRLEQTGRQIAACAASFGVPFHFTAWVGMTAGSFRVQDCVSPNRSRDEVFVVLSTYPLRYIHDDFLNPPMKRVEIFKDIRAANPEAYIQGIVTGSYSTPFFLWRFREALSHFASQYDMIDTFIVRQNKDRIVFESEILGKAVLNIVACEQTNVLERVDKYKQWYAATKGAGLEQIPLKQEMKQEVQKILKSWHKDYIVTEDLNYLLMGWKGRTLHALAAWKGLSPSRA